VLCIVTLLLGKPASGVLEHWSAAREKPAECGCRYDDIGAPGDLGYIYRSSEIEKAAAALHYNSATSDARRLPGRMPEEAAAYEAQIARGGWECKDRAGTALLARVNDDYCECADGSDEPGTSACSGRASPGKHFFRCPHSTKPLPPSRINDGVCDCCDASDEMVPSHIYLE